MGKLLNNHGYEGTASGNQQQMVPPRRRHPLGLREPKGPGAPSHRLRPREEWIAELASHDELFFWMYDRLPKELPSIRDLQLAGLTRMAKA